MKTPALAILIAVCTTAVAFAAPATPSTLASYLALGPAGVTIGSTTFSNFTLEPLQTGATQIPTSILVNPINLFGMPTLEFIVQQTAAAGQLFELKLSYKVQDVSIVGAGVAFDLATASGDAAVTGTLDIDGPVPQPGTFIAVASAGFSTPSEQGSFPSVAALFAHTDLVVDGGFSGQGSVRSVRNNFQVVPEPSTALYGLGTLALCATRRLRRRA